MAKLSKHQKSLARYPMKDEAHGVFFHILALCTAWARGAKIVRHQTHNSKPGNVKSFGKTFLVVDAIK